MIQLTHDQVMIRLPKESNRTPGGVILPAKAVEEPMEGTVIATGPGYKLPSVLAPLEVRVGDRILFPKYAGTEIKDEDGNFLILREQDILAILL